jgi:hypothetical protein
MFSRIDKTIIVIQAYFCGVIISRNSDIQNLLRQATALYLIGSIGIFLNVLKNRLFFGPLSTKLQGA